MPPIDHIDVSNFKVQTPEPVSNIGVTFDRHMFLDEHVTNICKVCFSSSAIKQKQEIINQQLILKLWFMHFRAICRSIIGGGGNYSYNGALLDYFLLQLIVFKVCEHKYINYCPLVFNLCTALMHLLILLNWIVVIHYSHSNKQ